MRIREHIARQLKQIKAGGQRVLFRKIGKAISVLYRMPLYSPAICLLIIIRIIRPLLLVRIGVLSSARIGHFAANTELYLCELDAGINRPNGRYIDIFCLDYEPVCNLQLELMWRRLLRIWPRWLISPIARVNRLIPGGDSHIIGENTQHDRDVHNLMERFPPHIGFTVEEERRGAAGLRIIGIPEDVPYVCLIIRDSAYLSEHLPRHDLNYHAFRDTDAQNYVLAAEALANRGYFVLRMGAKVNAALSTTHPKVVDYAANGMRSDFMDIYLAAKCTFCITVGTGLDAIPIIFRRPVVQVNNCPLGYCYSWGNNPLLLTKHHQDIKTGNLLTMREIFTRGVGFCLTSSCYESSGIRLLENTPEEIRDAVIEMADRLVGVWRGISEDDDLQQQFWELFPTKAVDNYEGKPLHGTIRARFSALFLRKNPKWLN